jgi:hypothetical protein
MVFRTRGNGNIIERLRSLSIKFEGELTIYRVLNQSGVDTTYGPYGYHPVIQPYARYRVKTGRASNEGSISLTFDSPSLRAEGGEHPETYILEFETWSGCPTCLVYNIEPVIDRYTLGLAFLTDEGAQDGTWSYPSLASANSPADGYTTLYHHKKSVPNTVLRAWMLDYNSPSTVGNEKEYYWNWWSHRVYEVNNVPSLRVREAGTLAKDYLEDFYRRATVQETDVIYEPAFEIGDTIEFYDPTTGETYNRVIVGYRDSNSWTEPTTTLELANYT